MTDTEIANDAEIATDETTSLIASNKVEGTAVYGEDGEKLGSIYNFMVDKISGQVEYAVLQFGGIFGVGSDYYPLPWDKLTYDVEQGGYVVDVDKETLEAAPRYGADAQPAYDEAYGERVYGYYGLHYN
ncbi:PRC-barrel domain-containing protein [Sphingomonas psychrotolerans]|uniref:Photosystem reaction center subunit H n=1 Tax=Sphingomonas psychrotolerans TaxID=1327635 RepID=A0A2K8MA30_9SPHN|nr:PRC-barrel domain-containing protein [Sphingomonas psychrotolerans]ATY30742.1 photosystem reaction center subunit H [Sphingomonas psychrotolerans]